MTADALTGSIVSSLTAADASDASGHHLTAKASARNGEALPIAAAMLLQLLTQVCRG